MQIEVEGVNFIAIFDTPHIVKGLQNNNLEKDVKLPDGCLGKWEHFQKANELDSKSERSVRALHRIKEGYVFKEKMKKMKVDVAAQVYSRSMASFIITANNQGTLFNLLLVTSFLQTIFQFFFHFSLFLLAPSLMPNEAIGAAKFAMLVDETFKSMNGTSEKKDFEKPIAATLNVGQRIVKNFVRCISLTNVESMNPILHH